jgi:hypothetical protein
MSIDEPNGQQQQRVYITSDTPIEATVRTIDVDPAKLVALEIFRRHVALGSFHELRKKADEDRGRAKTSAALIFQSMIFDHGKVKQHCCPAWWWRTGPRSWRIRSDWARRLCGPHCGCWSRWR